jgi:hypothetical protein
MKKLLFLTIIFPLFSEAQSFNLPDTGISGVYEVIVGTVSAKDEIRNFKEYGFRVIDSVQISENQAFEIYGVKSELKSYRLQNGNIDSHGLMRILEWKKPLGKGVGYVGPEVIGVRMSVMMTKDVIRLLDIYQRERENGKPYLPIEPIFDNIYGNDAGKKVDFYNRPVGVREMGVYAENFNYVFFQRYGYMVPGYGTINPEAPLQTSEFTHHDFVIKGDMDTVTGYYWRALGMKPEAENPTLDGDFRKGPQRVFDMAKGYSHWYRGFVSPNNVCGKLKFFVPNLPRPDKSEHQRIGELGITIHSFYTPKLQMVYDLIQKEGIKSSKILKNEFNEQCFTFTGPDGASWQIIEKFETKNKPVKTFQTVSVNN